MLDLNRKYPLATFHVNEVKNVILEVDRENVREKHTEEMKSGSMKSAGIIDRNRQGVQ